MFKKILVAYDGSECAKLAAESAKELALKFGAAVTVLYAIHPIPRGWDVEIAMKAREAENVQGAACVSAMVEQLKKAGVHVEGQVIEGRAGDAIVKFARTHASDLIVIGSQGPALPKTFLLGRVSEQVAYAAHCPVLIVR